MIDEQTSRTNERVAKLEQWRDDHEQRHTREAQDARETLLLAVRNEIALSSASSGPINSVLKWVAGVIAVCLAAALSWLLKR